MRFFVMLFLLLAAPVWADTAAPQPLTLGSAASQRLIGDARAMIEAKDIAGFDQAIRAAHRADLVAKGDQNRQRALYAAFVSADPLVADFTASWLAAEPDSAYAQIARAWHLHALGWAMRGFTLRRYTYPPAMAEMDALHDAGLVLALQALDTAPDMIGASDAVIRLGQTRGMADQAEAELARIMDIAPNLGSMTRAANALAPKWGGSTEALDRVCLDHAGKVPDVPDYSVAMCTVDLYLDADVSGAATGWINAQLLQLPDHPHLLRARAQMALKGMGTMQEKIAALTAFLPTADYDDRIYLEAAYELDTLSNAGGPMKSDQYATLRQGYLPWLQGQLAINPADPGLLTEYIGMTSGPQNEDAPSLTDRKTVLRRALVAAPYNAGVLHALAVIEADSTTPEDLLRISPIIANTVVYSNYKTDYLSAFIDLYLYAYRHAANSPVNQPDDTQLAAFDAAVSCPLVRMARIVAYVCESAQAESADCPAEGYVTDYYAPPLQEIAARGACTHERTTDLEDLAYTPVEPLP